MKRGLTITVAVALLLFCAAIATVYVSIGSIIVDTIEEEGTRLTQTNVTLEEVDFAPSTGAATLIQMKVENPEGFKEKNAFSFEKIELWVDSETLNTDVLRVKSLILVAPEVIYEITSETDNLRTLKQYIKNSSGSLKTHKKLIIDNFYVKNGIVVIRANGLKKTAKLDDIHLVDIGTAENGLEPSELINQLMIPVLRNTTLATLKTNIKLSDQARNILNGALDETEEAFNSIRKLLNQ